MTVERIKIAEIVLVVGTHTTLVGEVDVVKVGKFFGFRHGLIFEFGKHCAYAYDVAVVNFAFVDTYIVDKHAVGAVLVGDEEDSSLGDFIADDNALQPLDSAIHANLKETCTRILSSLTPREERVLRMRFGIGMNTDHTLEEVGQQFNVTRERIRQIEAKAIKKLKHPTRRKKLGDYRNS